jgi:hypothetical protein
MPLKSNVKTRSGNRVRLLLNGTEVGFAQNARFADDYGLEPASGIGDIHVGEYVPGMARHTVNISYMVLIIGALNDQGFIPQNGDDVLKGLVFDTEILDKDTQNLIQKAIGCSYASGEYEVSKHAIVMQSVVLMALDKSGPIPNPYPTQN